MLRHSQESLFDSTADHSMPWSEDRPANQAASRESDEEPQTIAGCGLTICAWCLRSTTRRNGRSCGCWRRTLAESLALTLKEFNSANGLRVNLSVSATNSCPSSWLLKMSARPTEGSGSGSSGDWPTPLTNDDHAKTRKRGNLNLPVTVMWPTANAGDGTRGPNQRDGKRGRKLTDVIHTNGQWPTATVHGNTNRKGATKKSGDGLRTAAVNGLHDHASHSTNGKNRESLRLNHRWVAQLMGFPSDWLEDVEWPPSKRSATRSSRNARKS